MNFVMKVIRKGLAFPAYPEMARERRHKMESCLCGTGVQLCPESRVDNIQSTPSAIQIGPYSQILGQLLVFKHGGSIRIGESCYVGEDSRIWSANSITIGNRVLISHNVNIHDNNSHSLSAAARHKHYRQTFFAGPPAELNDVPSCPILIEDDVWIAFNATILKGVTIGRGAIVGASSVVTRDVAAYAVVAGNPARVIGAAKP